LFARHELNSSEAILKNFIETEPLLRNAWQKSQLTVKDFVLKSLEQFILSICTEDSRYSLFLEGKEKLTKEEMTGLTIFFGKAKCSQCHLPPDFTDNKFHDTGLFKRRLILQTRGNPESPDRFELGFDYGRGNIEPGEHNVFSFRTPSLYNVQLTAPYMHDEEVVDFYNRGGDAPSTKHKPLNLNNKEKVALVAFLKTLTDLRYLNPEQAAR
jgi:cytochrome c peroxidase